VPNVDSEYPDIVVETERRPRADQPAPEAAKLRLAASPRQAECGRAARRDPYGESLA